jgi:hypothetical protein
MLLHRNARDDAKCARKYGKDWEEYKRRVPYSCVVLSPSLLLFLLMQLSLYDALTFFRRYSYIYGLF